MAYYMRKGILCGLLYAYEEHYIEYWILQVGYHGNTAIHLPAPDSHRMALIFYQTDITEPAPAGNNILGGAFEETTHIASAVELRYRGGAPTEEPSAAQAEDRPVSTLADIPAEEASAAQTGDRPISTLMDWSLPHNEEAATLQTEPARPDDGNACPFVHTEAGPSKTQTEQSATHTGQLGIETTEQPSKCVGDPMTLSEQRPLIDTAHQPVMQGAQPFISTERPPLARRYDTPLTQRTTVETTLVQYVHPLLPHNAGAALCVSANQHLSSHTCQSFLASTNLPADLPSSDLAGIHVGSMCVSSLLPTTLATDEVCASSNQSLVQHEMCPPASNSTRSTLPSSLHNMVHPSKPLLYHQWIGPSFHHPIISEDDTAIDNITCGGAAQKECDGQLVDKQSKDVKSNTEEGTLPSWGRKKQRRSRQQLREMGTASHTTVIASDLPVTTVIKRQKRMSKSKQK
jgi:hypothetical protein